MKTLLTNWWNWLAPNLLHGYRLTFVIQFLMSKSIERSSVKAIGYGIIVLILIATGYLSDRILLAVGTRNRETHKNQHPIYKNIYRKSGNKTKNLDLTRTNYGPYLKEGALTSEAELNLIHHGNYDDFTAKINDLGHVVWVLGDSWGVGIKKNEIQNRTLQTNLDDSYSKMRIFAANSWSPLLMHMAYKDRIKRYNEIPDKVVIFIDQTDIGNDFCMYRPYVHRDSLGNLIGVLPGRFDTLEGLMSWKNTLAFGEIHSGWHLLSIKIANQYLRNSIQVPGFTVCDYNDILAWQMGKERSPNGVNTRQYASYLQSTILGFLNYVKISNSDVQILLVTHDWAQHSINSDQRFKKNISEIVSSAADRNPFTRHLHVQTLDYPASMSLEDIYQYPSDPFSHLRDYSTLSAFIAKSLSDKSNP